MTMRIVNSVKYLGSMTLILLSMMACEKDFENIGVTPVHNNQISNKDTKYQIINSKSNCRQSRGKNCGN